MEVRGHLWGPGLSFYRVVPGMALRLCCSACTVNAFTTWAISPAPMNYFLKRHFSLSLPEYTRNGVHTAHHLDHEKKFKRKLKCSGNNLLKRVLVFDFNFNKSVTSFYNRQLEPSHSESHQGEPSQCWGRGASLSAELSWGSCHSDKTENYWP